jgi:hypothetical protein
MLASVLALPAESLTVKVGLRLFLSSALQSSQPACLVFRNVGPELGEHSEGHRGNWAAGYLHTLMCCS